MLQAMLYQTMPLNLNVKPPSTPDATSCGGSTTDGSDHDVAVVVETPDPPKRKRRRQQRATYHIRKDEIQDLQQRAEALELELQALKLQTLLTKVNGDKAGAEPQRTPLAKSEMTQTLLQDAARTQQCTLAGLQGLMSTYSSLQDTSPLHAGVRLSANYDERRATLAAARGPAIERAKRFVTERSAGLDQLRAFSEQERFEGLHGSYCVANFDVLPLPTSATSAFNVKSAHDAFCYLVRNVEITFSEWVGPITVRENEESADLQCSQHRLVSFCPYLPFAHIETNMIVFSDFCADTDFGIIVVDSVADDALYPYKPDQRVRWDSSSVFLFTKHDDKVVLLRWSFTKVHPSPLFRVARERRVVHSSLGLWGDKLLESIQDTAARAAGELLMPPVMSFPPCGGN